TTPHPSHAPHPHSFPTRLSSDLQTDIHPEGGRLRAATEHFVPGDASRSRGTAQGSRRAAARSPRRSHASASGNTDSRCLRARLRSEEHTSELQSPCNLVCRLLLE